MIARRGVPASPLSPPAGRLPSTERRAGLPVHRAAPSHPAAGGDSAHAVRTHRSGLRLRAGRTARRRLDPAAPGRAARRAHRHCRPRAGRQRPACPRDPGRGLAGERRRPLRPRAGYARRPARSELQRRRPGAHGHRRAVPVHDDPAGRVSLGEPRQRVASRARALLGVRALLPDAAHHPDVLPPATRCWPSTPSSTRSPPSAAASGWWPRSTSR